MDDEYDDLLATIINILEETDRKSIQKNHVWRLLRRIDSGIIKQLTLAMAEKLRTEAHMDFADNVKMVQHWAKILSSPKEELPTLLGVRPDLDGLIEERLKA